MKADVHVICLTYNHEEYISEALESFVRQKTNFHFKVYVGDDCSTDSTKEKILHYYQKYPDIIVPVFRENNIGPTNNLADLCTRFPAKYIAFCEGDDYWIDENKLQKQYDYMEQHLDVGICFTKTKITYPENWGLLSWYKMIDGEILYPDSIPGFIYKDFYNAEDIIKTNIAHTSSYFFRWKFDFKFPNWFYNAVSGDIPLFILHLGKGKAGYIPEITSVYRRNDTGVFMTYEKTQFFIKTRCEYIRYLEGLIDYFNENYDGYATDTMKARLNLEYNNLLTACREAKDYSSVAQLIKLYPKASTIFFNYLQDSIKQLKTFENKLGFQRVKLILDNSIVSKLINSYIDVIIGKKNKNNLLEDLISCETELRKLRKRSSTKQWVKRKLNKLISKFYFDENFYIKKYPEVKCSELSLKDHYLEIGKNKGYQPFNFNWSLSHLLKSFLLYWICSLIPKNKSLWVFSSFGKKGYLDNTKYLYEYINDNHPEIQAVWLTCDKAVYDLLKSKNKPVKFMNKMDGRLCLIRAKVAFTDHFISSDYSSKYGLNFNTKIVQLWHGVGLKSIAPINDIYPNTDIPGVRLSSDILIEQGDNLILKIKKILKFSLFAPFREFPERYFGLLCPGQEHIDYVAKPWKVPQESLIFSGHPRNIHLYNFNDQNRIIYAPTYRWSEKDERELIDKFLISLPKLNKILNDYKYTLTLRLHPHTWRNYSKYINEIIAKYDNIYLDNQKDVYEDLGSYKILISDYSSIAYDFLLTGKPIIFLNYDLEKFKRRDDNLNYPYESYSPGFQVKNWDEVISSIVSYINDPSLHHDWRNKVKNEFFFSEVNDKNNSERIINNLKQRLKIYK